MSEPSTLSVDEDGRVTFEEEEGKNGTASGDLLSLENKTSKDSVDSFSSVVLEVEPDHKITISDNVVGKPPIGLLPHQFQPPILKQLESSTLPFGGTKEKSIDRSTNGSARFTK